MIGYAEQPLIMPTLSNHYAKKIKKLIHLTTLPMMTWLIQMKGQKILKMIPIMTIPIIKMMMIKILMAIYWLIYLNVMIKTLLTKLQNKIKSILFIM